MRSTCGSPPALLTFITQLPHASFHLIIRSPSSRPLNSLCISLFSGSLLLQSILFVIERGGVLRISSSSFYAPPQSLRLFFSRSRPRSFLPRHRSLSSSFLVNSRSTLLSRSAYHAPSSSLTQSYSVLIPSTWCGFDRRSIDISHDKIHAAAH
jgi:hypothetical protein